mmetsp:Transcript_44771/g.37676  ORF Transcript_44771/g.37676 Transcript_44771/m.37676 type:complete len:97 (-) Transcript_44771:853-1143(-)
MFSIRSIGVVIGSLFLATHDTAVVASDCVFLDASMGISGWYRQLPVCRTAPTDQLTLECLCATVFSSAYHRGVSVVLTGGRHFCSAGGDGRDIKLP